MDWTFMAKIVLVDDEKNILTSVRMALESKNHKVTEFHDGKSALEYLLTHSCDIAILDIKMPRMDGIELLRRLREKNDLPVIFLTSKDTEIDELLGLKMGADDYIHKPFSPRLLIERVNTVLRRNKVRRTTTATDSSSATHAKDIIEHGDLFLDLNRYDCRWKKQSIRLTVTEFLILKALVLIPGVVKSRDALLDAAYSEEAYSDDRTIDSHIKRLRKKFKKVDDNFDMIETLYGIGYLYRKND